MQTNIDKCKHRIYPAVNKLACNHTNTWIYIYYTVIKCTMYVYMNSAWHDLCILLPNQMVSCRTPGSPPRQRMDQHHHHCHHPVGMENHVFETTNGRLWALKPSLWKQNTFDSWASQFWGTISDLHSAAKKCRKLVKQKKKFFEFQAIICQKIKALLLPPLGDQADFRNQADCWAHWMACWRACWTAYWMACCPPHPHAHQSVPSPWRRPMSGDAFQQDFLAKSAFQFWSFWSPLRSSWCKSSGHRHGDGWGHHGHHIHGSFLSARCHDLELLGP